MYLRAYWWLGLSYYHNFPFIYIITLIFMFLRSRNPFLAFLLGSKIKVNFRFTSHWWCCLIDFWKFFTIHVFEVEESIVDILTRLSDLGDLENSGQLPVQEVLEVLMIVSYGFSQYLQYICFQGQGIICCHFYWATMLGGPQKSKTTSGSDGFRGHS